MATGSVAGLPCARSVAAIVSASPSAHVDRAGVGRDESRGPRARRLVGADARRGERHAARAAALRERGLEIGGGGERRGDARHDLAGDAGGFERGDLLLRAAEEHRVAALEAHDDAVLARGVDQALVDELLRGGMPAAALADRDPLRALRRARRCPGCTSASWNTMSAAASSARRAQRQEVRRTRTGADEIDGPGARCTRRSSPPQPCRWSPRRSG